MMNPTIDMQSVPIARTEREKTAALRRRLFRQLVLELATQRPVMRMAARAIVVMKIGEAGAATWAARWNSDSTFATSAATA